MSIRSAITAAPALRRVILGAIVAAGLTLGSREALAANVALSCPYDGGHFLGNCFVPDTCNDQCLVIHPNGFGSCVTGCCKCYW